MNRNSKQFKEDTKKFESICQNTIKCKCGCSNVFNFQTERQICRWCGNYVYKDNKTEFKYKIKEQLNKKRNNKEKE